MKFEGIYTPAITPLSADGSIDTQAFTEVLEFLVESKVHGIVIGGSTGEYYAHTAEERLALAAHASEVIAGRLPLVVGTGAIRTEDSLAYAEAARAIGADAILVGSPPYALPTSREIAEHVLAVDRAAGLPIMLYNYPARMGVEMDEAFFAAVAGCRNIVAIKESSGSTAQCTAWPAATRGSPCPAAGTTRPWSSSPGARAVGSAPAPTSSLANTSPCTRPAWSRTTSPRAGASWRR